MLPDSLLIISHFSFCIICKKERRNKVTSQTTVQPSSTSAQARWTEVTQVTFDPQQHEEKHGYKVQGRWRRDEDRLTVEGWKTKQLKTPSLTALYW